MSSMTAEMQSLKTSLKEIWSSGNFARIATDLETGAGEFVSRIPIEPGARVLDVACGSGQVALRLARAGAQVTGLDIAPNLIAQARASAAEQNIGIRFDEGDAEDLPYEDGSFDMVISIFGAMFAPRPDRVAAEMRRVCRPGGRIIMGNWTPEGFIGEMFRTVAKHNPPPAGMPSPLLWGKEDVVRERLGDGAADLRFEKRLFPFRYALTPAGVVDHFRTYFGPILKAFGKLDEAGQAALRRDLESLWAKGVSPDGTIRVESEYLEIVAVRAGA